MNAAKRFRWHRSLYGKISLFLFASIVLAYGLGAAAGWLIVDKSLEESWRKQALLNAQVSTFSVRSIYTFVAIESSGSGQVERIRTDRPIGDDESVLDTGFNPADVLAQAAAQTHNTVWLFDSNARGLVSAVNSTGDSDAEPLILPADTNPASFYVGFAAIGDTRHFVASIPVVHTDGRLLGAVVTSIGEADDILERSHQMALNSLYVLVGVLVAAAIVVTLVMRQMFSPVPVLVRMLTRIARDDTGTVTPFQDRTDEIGHLAMAIETLREAVVERENLRQVRDVAERMEHLAHHDSLTGLPNRALFNLRIAEAAERLISEGTRFNVLLVDLDRFKAVNDTLGHAMGDLLLTSVTERLSRLLGMGDVAARLGGDEFAVLQMVNQNPIVEGSRLAEEIVVAIGSPFGLDGQDVSIGASIGIACAPLHASTASDLMKRADIALYGSKAAGRGNFHIYKDGMVMADPNRYALVRDLEGAAERGELRLEYQPFFTAVGNVLAGYEALLRWDHPAHGIVMPEDFIGLAEEAGQIVDMGAWVLERACAQAAELPRAMKMAINVSPLEVSSRDFTTRLAETFKRHDIRPERFELEIALLNRQCDDAMIEILKGIEAMGVTIVLDRFGTGGTGLDGLSRLPAKKLKIDRRLIAEMRDRPSCRTIVTGVIQLARSIGLATAASGVENDSELELIRLAGCDFVQGYHLGAAMAVAAPGEAPMVRPRVATG